MYNCCRKSFCFSYFFITCQQPILNSENLFDLVKLHTSYFVTFISILVSFEKLLHREKNCIFRIGCDEQDIFYKLFNRIFLQIVLSHFLQMIYFITCKKLFYHIFHQIIYFINFNYLKLINYLISFLINLFLYHL